MSGTDNNGEDDFSIDLKSFYADNKYAQDLLDDKFIKRKLKDTLGNEYDYLKECLTTIDDITYYTDYMSYYMEGGIPGLYTIMEASLVIYQNGEVEGAYLYNNEIFYFSSVVTERMEIHQGIFNWMYEKKNNSLHVEEGGVEIAGTYIEPESNNYIKIKADDNGYFMDLFGSYGVNIGGVEEYIQQYDINNWGYFEDEDRGIRLMFAKDTVLVFEYGTWGGLGVTLSGQYYRH